ncbi:DUF1134 domain-containing protein [Chelatococcus asaccharovorans]|uniref:DUF1134 domain-containing protein n=2 Tax=Chelatococcus asaccharovorans TaxID=28210 RepID=UPI00224C7555|nr:DUF1134 domain-containing protein [Chelatococcus asaccharovorans]CAH1654069.1 conserved exported hypothetical protein [Chelatococcus asaccharovorans]CAH1685855.1 conserved exported hypothetical protein [Chelatococcus asaccharovorans]
MSRFYGLMMAGIVAILLAVAGQIPTAAAQGGGSGGQGQQAPETFSPDELVTSGHKFFGNVSRGIALTIQEATRRWGQPNGYILGQEGSGAFFGGLRYGEGILYTRNAGDRRVFWQGPSLGFDIGGDGARTMMLVYNLPAVDAIFERFAGINGSAYLVAGFGMTALTNNGIIIVPIKSGVGARLGVNLGYVKFTPTATWNPF